MFASDEASVRDVDAPLSRPAAEPRASAARSRRTASSRSSCSPRARTSTITIPRPSPICSSGWRRRASSCTAFTRRSARASSADAWGAPLTLASADADARAHGGRRSRARAAHRAAHSGRSVWWCISGCRAPRAVAGRQQPRRRRGAASRSCGGSRRRSASRRARSDSRTSCREPARSSTSSRRTSRRSDVGICLDFGHAHMDGDLVDAIETVSDHSDHDPRARQPRPHRRSSRAVRRHDRLAGGADRGAEDRLRRHALFEIAAHGRRSDAAEGTAWRANGCDSC